MAQRSFEIKIAGRSLATGVLRANDRDAFVAVSTLPLLSSRSSFNSDQLAHTISRVAAKRTYDLSGEHGAELLSTPRCLDAVDSDDPISFKFAYLP